MSAASVFPPPAIPRNASPSKIGLGAKQAVQVLPGARRIQNTSAADGFARYRAQYVGQLFTDHMVGASFRRGTDSEGGRLEVKQGRDNKDDKDYHDDSEEQPETPPS